MSHAIETLLTGPGGPGAAVPVALAPMAGITDLPFRRLVASFGTTFGAGWVVSEMVASQEMVQGKPGVRERADLGLGLNDTVVQIAGREAYWMAEAARRLVDDGARVIDINMGCPAKKVTNGYSGSALLRDPDLALRLIEAVVGAVDVPVTLKTRLGWDADCLNAADVARRAEAAGVRLITIHGRTRAQFYGGAADWAAIRAIRDAVRIPVVANGDIVDTVSARSALTRSGAAALMMGRGAQGRPWQPALIAAALAGTAALKIPEGAAFCDMVSGHYDAMLGFYGNANGARVARKHLGWYMDVAATPPSLRREVLTAPTPAQTFALLSSAMAPADKIAA